MWKLPNRTQCATCLEYRLDHSRCNHGRIVCVWIQRHPSFTTTEREATHNNVIQVYCMTYTKHSRLSRTWDLALHPRPDPTPHPNDPHRTGFPCVYAGWNWPAFSRAHRSHTWYPMSGSQRLFHYARLSEMVERRLSQVFKELYQGRALRVRLSIWDLPHQHAKSFIQALLFAKEHEPCLIDHLPKPHFVDAPHDMFVSYQTLQVLNVFSDSPNQPSLFKTLNACSTAVERGLSNKTCSSPVYPLRIWIATMSLNTSWRTDFIQNGDSPEIHLRRLG